MSQNPKQIHVKGKQIKGNEKQNQGEQVVLPPKGDPEKGNNILDKLDKIVATLKAEMGGFVSSFSQVISMGRNIGVESEKIEDDTKLNKSDVGIKDKLETEAGKAPSYNSISPENATSAGHTGAVSSLGANLGITFAGHFTSVQSLARDLGISSSSGTNSTNLGSSSPSVSLPPSEINIPNIPPTLSPPSPPSSPPADHSVGINNLTAQSSGGDALVREADLLASRGVGKSEGSDQIKGSTTVQSTFTISAPDGVGNLSIDGHSIISNNVFTSQSFSTSLGNVLSIISYDSDTGIIVYQYTLEDNQNHSFSAGDNSLFDNMSVSLADLDGESVSSTLSINIIDDVPSIVSSGIGAPTLEVSEEHLSSAISSSFSNLFSFVKGADGATVSYSLSLKSSGELSGLVDTASHTPIHMYLEGGEVVGRIGDSNGDIAFTISINAANAEITLEQFSAVEHPNGSDPHDIISLSNVDLISIQAIITDADGDSALASRDIGDSFKFQDSGPSISLVVSAPADSISVDESALGTSASANFADNFSASSSYGADGAGSISSSYTLGISSSGANSGLVDEATGQNVLLYMNGSSVEGRTSTSNAVVFTLSIDASGSVTLDQIRALQHPNTSDPDDTVTLSSSNLIQITRTDTITDKDGDQASSSATINMGQALIFHDDGPSISVSVVSVADLISVDESALGTSASANFADNFSASSSYGADGAGSISSSYTLGISASGANSGLIDEATGENVLLYMNGSSVEGRTSTSNAVVFTLSIDASGSVTLDQIRALQHPNTSDPDDAVTLSSSNLIQITRTDTIIDKDGDSTSSSASLDIAQALSFHDDAPSISVSVVSVADLISVDESSLGTPASANFADNFSASSSYGADGAGSISSSYALGISSSGADSGLKDALSGENVLLYMNGSTVEGRTSTSHDVVFTVSVDGSGIVSLDQIRTILHPDGAETLSSADLIQITRTDTIIDRDGDEAVSSGSIDIGEALIFNNGGPTISLSVVASADLLSVDESTLSTNATANFSDNFSETSDYGTAGAGSISSSYSLSILSSGADSGLKDVATGEDVLLYMNAGVVEGRTSGSHDLVFTVSVDNSGTVTLDQIRGLIHPDGSDPNDSVTLNSSDLISLTRTDTITDSASNHASSSASLDIAQALNFHDDAPSISMSVVSVADLISVDESALGTPASANFADNFSASSSYGADGAGSISSSYTLGISSSGANSGLVDEATGQNVLLYMNGSAVEGRTSGSNDLVFTLSIDGSGEVTLLQERALSHPDNSDPNDAVSLSASNLIQITRTDTITDKDGDSASSSASIDIAQALNFHDDAPSISVNVVSVADLISVDESALGTPASANFADNFSASSSYGADGAGSISSSYTLGISSSGANSGLVDEATGENVLLYMNGSSVEGRTSTSNAVVFTLSIDASGSVTLDQIRALQHPNTSDPDDAVTLSSSDLIQITRTDTITDKDGDSASSSASLDIAQALNFHDDAPSISVNVVSVADLISVDESALGTPASANFADNFSASSSYGADGAGSISSSYTLGISSSGANSGLVDEATGQNVLLYMNGSTVEGRTSTSNAVVFTVSVDGSGSVTLDQIRALQHPNTSDPDDTVTLSSSNLIQITRTDTITDKDGDQASSSATINMGQALIFHDDGPSISVSATAVADTLSVDETNLSINASANFADNFTITSSYGADGAGSTATSYTLGISSSGANSGLVDEATGQSVLLYMNGSTVEGRTSTSNAVVFTVSVDASGSVTLDQIRALQHPNTSNPDDTVTLSSSNLIQITRTDTITDKDGDQASSSATINMGQALIFHDDGPSISVSATAVADTLSVDETNLSINATANFADNFTITSSYGADGAGSTATSYTLGISSSGANSGLVDEATGQNVLLYMNGSTVEGRTSTSNAVVFTVSVDASGSVTLDQIRALQHPNTSNPDDTVTLSSSNLIQITRTDTITDKDGDQASSSATINMGQALIFHDDGPSISVSAIAVADTLSVDETNLSINATANFADNFTITSSYGADGAGSTATSYTLGISSSGANSGLVDEATGQSVLLYMNGSTVEGRTSTSNAVVFTVSVDASGSVTLDQIRALQHPNTSNPDDTVTLSSSNLIQITRTDTITDKDGDQASSSASINMGQALIFHDDGPSISVSAIAVADTLSVDETNLSINASANFADNFSVSSSYGADGAGSTATSYTLGISSSGANSGLVDEATGQSVLLYMNGSTVEGRTSTSNAVVFTVSVDASGSVTLDQIRALQHPNTSNPDDTVTLSSSNLIQITRTDTITDKDGDQASSSASINMGQALIFHDDGPSISVSAIAVADTLSVDETNLSINASANFADNFSASSSYGADGAGSTATSYTLGISSSGANSGLVDEATGQSVLLYMNGSTVEGRTSTSNAVVFTVSVDASGSVTLDQIRALQHPNTSNPDDTVTLSSSNLIQITRTDTITDKDGDQASSSATINMGQALIFHDDGPSISVSATAVADTLSVDETNLSINATANFADNFTMTSSYGADGAGSTSTSYALSISSSGVNSGLIDIATGQSVLLYMNGSTVEGRTSTSNAVVFTVSLDGSGNVTLDQIRALSHPNTSNPDDIVTLSSSNLIQITRTDTITDKEGDSASSSATINMGQALVFHDDAPTLSNVNDPNANSIVQLSAYNPGTTSIQNIQLFDWSFGADGSTNLTLGASKTGNVVLSSATSAAATLNFYDSSNTLIATMVVNQSGTDVITLYHRSNALVSDSLSTSAAKAGGPGIYYVDSTTDTSLTVKVTATTNGVADSVNPSTQGWAVGNNVITYGESLQFTSLNKTTLLADPVHNFGFATSGFTGGASTYAISIKVYYSDLTTQTITTTATEGQVFLVSSLPGIDTSKLINEVDVTNIDSSKPSSGFRLTTVNVTVESSTPPSTLDYTFSLNVTDKDGDTAAQSFTVHLDGTAASSTPGYSIDGPIVGATVFQDLNFDSVLSSNENYSITDNYGAYNLMAIDTNLDGMTNYLDGRLVSYGGTDSETGLSYNIPFYAPLGSEVISPLTSILEVQIENSLNHDLTQINEHLANVLGLGSTDLQSLNPISAAEQGNVQALTQAAGIMTLSVQLSAALDGMLGTTSDHHVNDIYKAIGDEVMKLSDGSVADFSQTSLLSAIVDNLSSQLGIESSKFDPIMDVLKSSQDALKSSVANLSEGEDVVSAISSVQQVTQGVYAEAITHFYQTDSGQGTVLTAEDINLQSSSSSAPTVTSSSSADDALHTLTSTPTSETSSPAPNPTASPVVTETAAPDTSAPPPVTNPLEDAAKNSSGEM